MKYEKQFRPNKNEQRELPIRKDETITEEYDLITEAEEDDIPPADVGNQTIEEEKPKVRCPYSVVIVAEQLNCRRGPGTIYGVVGAVFKDQTHEIVEEADGKGASKWGKLKNGNGWVSLDFCIMRTE